MIEIKKRSDFHQLLDLLICDKYTKNYYIAKYFERLYIREVSLCTQIVRFTPISVHKNKSRNVPCGHIYITMNRKNFIKFRCTNLEKAIIKKKADNCGLSLSEFTRSTALQQKVSYKFTDEEMEIYQMLLKYHKNFTDISNLHKIRDPSVSNLTKELALEIKDILKKLQ